LSNLPALLVIVRSPTQLAQQSASKQLSHHPVSMGHLYVLTRLATPHVSCYPFRPHPSMTMMSAEATDLCIEAQQDASANGFAGRLSGGN
jgi:hypothetical protein